MRSLPTWPGTDPGGFEPGVNLFAVRRDIFATQEAFGTRIKSPSFRAHWGYTPFG